MTFPITAAQILRIPPANLRRNVTSASSQLLLATWTTMMKDEYQKLLFWSCGGYEKQYEYSLWCPPGSFPSWLSPPDSYRALILQLLLITALEKTRTGFWEWTCFAQRLIRWYVHKFYKWRSRVEVEYFLHISEKVFESASVLLALYKAIFKWTSWRK